MRTFADLPIRRKLTLAIVLTSAIALLVATGAMVAYEILRFRHSLVRELSTEAEIIAANSAAALAFSDAPAAWETLAALRAQPGIVHACLFTKSGEVFAEYKPGGDDLPLVMEPSGHRFEKGYALVFRQVRFGGNLVGGIGLRSDLQEQTARLKTSASIAAVTLLTALLVSVLLSVRLQRAISTPVLELANVAHAVTLRKDYSLRATRQSNDEIGRLVEEFNQMLAQIEKRNADLHASEERFRQMAESIREVFWLMSLPMKKIIYVSPAYEGVWGRTRESLYAAENHWIDSIHEDDRPRMIEALTNLPPDSEMKEEYRIVRPDGTIRWIHDRGFPVRDETGQTYRRAGIAEDITKRKEVEAALKQVEANYRSIFENAIDGIFQTTPEGRYLAANPAMARMLGYTSPEELIASVQDLGKDVCFTPESRIELLQQLEKDGQIEGFENQLYRKDGGTIWVRLNARTVRDPSGAILYFEGTAQDITARRHLEKHLVEISDREQSRMGQDLHDGLCQHLVRIAFTSNLLERDLAAQSNPQVCQATKVCRLVDDAITQARNLARGLYPVKLEVEGLHSALQELAANVRSNYGLDCDIESSDSILIADPALATHLYRIAQEATINAVKHAQPKQIRIRLIDLDSKIFLTITDNGVGIPASTSRTGGMGLHIMSNRARLIGAELNIQPLPGGGTIVSCLFEPGNGIERA